MASHEYCADKIPEMWQETAAFGCAQSSAQGIAAVPCSDGTVHIIQISSGGLSASRMLNVAMDLDAPVMCTSAAFKEDGSQLAVLAHDGSVLIYDTRSWQPSKVGCVQGCMDMAWLPDVCCHHPPAMLAVRHCCCILVTCQSYGTNMCSWGAARHSILVSPRPTSVRASCRAALH